MYRSPPNKDKKSKATSCKTLGIRGLSIEEKQLKAYFIIVEYQMIVFYVSTWENLVHISY